MFPTKPKFDFKKYDDGDGVKRLFMTAVDFPDKEIVGIAALYCKLNAGDMLKLRKEYWPGEELVFTTQMKNYYRLTKMKGPYLN